MRSLEWQAGAVEGMRVGRLRKTFTCTTFKAGVNKKSPRCRLPCSAAGSEEARTGQR